MVRCRLEDSVDWRGDKVGQFLTGSGLEGSIFVWNIFPFASRMYLS